MPVSNKLTGSDTYENVINPYHMAQELKLGGHLFLSRFILQQSRLPMFFRQNEKKKGVKERSNRKE